MTKKSTPSPQNNLGAKEGHGERDGGGQHAPGCCCQPAKSLDFHTGLETSEPLVRAIPYHTVPLWPAETSGGSGGRLWHLECIFGFFLARSTRVSHAFKFSFPLHFIHSSISDEWNEVFLGILNGDLLSGYNKVCMYMCHVKTEEGSWWRGGKVRQGLLKYSPRRTRKVPSERVSFNEQPATWHTSTFKPRSVLYSCGVSKFRMGSIWIWLLKNWQVLLCFIFIQPSCLCDINMYISVSGENEQNPIFGWFVRKPCQIPIMVDGPGQLHVSCRSKVRPLPLGGPPLRAFRPCGPWKMVGR